MKPAEVTTQAVTPVEEGTPAPLQPAVPASDSPAPESPAESATPDLELSSAAVPMLPRTGTDPLPLARLGILLVALGAATLTARTASLSRP